jgi:eukaryotic-like serine/threonine-protein kinase
MIPSKVEGALAQLVRAVSSNAGLVDGIVRVWEQGSSAGLSEYPEVHEAATVLDRGLPAISRTSNAEERLAPFLSGLEAEILLAWCAAGVHRADIRLFPILQVLGKVDAFGERVLEIARDRIVQGPLDDALSCVGILGRKSSLGSVENAEARARIEILLWEAGNCLSHPVEFARSLWRDGDLFQELVVRPATGTLRGRVLSARCLELTVADLPPSSEGLLLGETLRVLQPLLLHPEPLVSSPAARAVGRLAGRVDHLEAMLLDWLGGRSPLLRQRAMTAMASLPGARVRALRREFEGAMAGEAGALALEGAAMGTPHLFFEARDVWDDILARARSGDAGSSKAARELARGLWGLFRLESRQGQVRGPLRELRLHARRVRPETVSEQSDWLRVLAWTDAVEGAERDPIDIETGLENLVHLAAEADDEEADARAARLAASLGRTFEDARELTLGGGSLRERATGINAMVGAARSLALGLWGPQLATSPSGTRSKEPALDTARAALARAPSELLDQVREVRLGAVPTGNVGQLEDLEHLALILGGYALDCASAGPNSVGSVAHATCRWLQKLEGVADGSRQLPEALKLDLSALFWRLVDTTRGTALGAVDDVEWLGPFAAWWALVLDQPTLLTQLGTALPMIRDDALSRCSELAERTRQLIMTPSLNGSFLETLPEVLSQLHALETELGAALLGLGEVLRDMSGASGRDTDLESKCTRLTVAAERLQSALADPGRGLHAVGEASPANSSEHVSRTANLVARSIRSRELSMLDVWFTSLGPVTSALVERQVRDALERTPPPPPSRQKLKAEMIEGYELVKPLGEGGVGKVWLVRKPGADRLFVLKIPKVEALANASESERAGLLASFVEEAKALASLYHPNVANIIDRGVSKDVPFLVLELLIGADLQKYSHAKLLSFAELVPIVLDTCAGLAALHGAKLVHRDIKPANIWLRLPLAHGEKFAAEAHRDPAKARPLSAVVIDFGMVRPMRVSAETSGRFVAGTPGYIAPDQVLDPVELDGRADVYALAGTIYNVTTGRTFFDDIKNPRDRIFAHMQKDPLEEASLLQGYPPALARLMRAAVAQSPKDRPLPLEFARAFEEGL